MKPSLRRAIRNDELRGVLLQAERMGCTITLTKGGHIRVQTTAGPVFASVTPRTGRAAQHLRRDLRARGIEV